MRTIGSGVALCVMVAVLVSAAQAASDKLITRVTIYDTEYAVVDARDVLSRVPQSMVQAVVAVSRYCSTAKAYGYYGGGEVGVVAWGPRSFIGCIDGDDNDGQVIGGGPGGLCGLYYKTARNHVAVFASTPRLCARLTSQAPGGYPAKANRAIPLPDGTQINLNQPLLIMCQRYTTRLMDYVLLKGGTVPGSRRPYFVPDDWLNTNNQSRLTSLPLC